MKASPKVFISYVRDNLDLVARLRTDLEKRGIQVWQDLDGILPGERWKHKIRRSIEDGDFFIACFSQEYYEREKTHMNEELTTAVEQLRLRLTNKTWFIPVLLNDSHIPSRDIGDGASLSDLQYVSLHINWDEGIERISRVILDDLKVREEEEIPQREFIIKVLEEEIQLKGGLEKVIVKKKKPDDPIKIFISYSHYDSKYLTENEFNPYLKSLEQHGVKYWKYTDSQVGAKWDDEIRKKIADCDVALLLVSQHFLVSDYIQRVEVTTFLSRQEKDGLGIFPIMLSACGYKHYEWLQGRTFLPIGKNIAQHYQNRGKRLALYVDIFENELYTVILDERREREKYIQLGKGETVD